MQTIDRAQHVRDLIPEMPEQIRGIVGAYTGQKAHVFEKKLVLEASVSASDLLGYYAATATDTAASMAHAMATHHASNPNFQAGKLFYGMTPQDYANEITGKSRVIASRLNEAREEIGKTGMKEALEASMMGVKRRRKPCVSENDGDVDYERRYEEKPFRSFEKRAKTFPFIEVIVPIGFNCNTDANAISLFNARALALCEVVEKCGYRVAITAEYWSMRNVGGSRSCSGIFGKSIYKDDIHCLIRTTIRDADQYGDIESFAPTASVEFLRRVMFGVDLSLVHYIHGLKSEFGLACDGNKGRAIHSRPLEAAPGQLVLTDEIVAALFSTNEETRKRMFELRVLGVFNYDAHKAS